MVIIGIARSCRSRWKYELRVSRYVTSFEF